ncbi:MAG: DUF1028 domain-containing protein [Actinobacteria bacterium]|nr:DUF1028 domain-containing protein [Actinomycetota bacterium]
MTFTLIAYDPDSNSYGACLRTSVPCAGGLAIQVSLRGVVATQAYVNSDLAIAVMQELDEGATSGEAGDRALRGDRFAELRQLAVLTKSDEFVHTGSSTLPWRGHVSGAHHIAVGNRMSGRAALEAISLAYRSGESLDFPDRLVDAMRAGDDAGGEQASTPGFALGTTQGSATLQIASPTPHMFHNVRVDAHDDPLSELRRVVDVTRNGERVMQEFYPEGVEVLSPFFWRHVD